jgi:hypothetical protein
VLSSRAELAPRGLSGGDSFPDEDGESTVPTLLLLGDGSGDKVAEGSSCKGDGLRDCSKLFSKSRSLAIDRPRLGEASRLIPAGVEGSKDINKASII